MEAKLYWEDHHGRNRGDDVRLLLDSGCTGPTLNRDPVWKHRVPKVKRDRLIVVNTVEDAGVEYSEDVIPRIGSRREELA